MRKNLRDIYDVRELQIEGFLNYKGKGLLNLGELNWNENQQVEYIENLLFGLIPSNLVFVSDKNCVLTPLSEETNNKTLTLLAFKEGKLSLKNSIYFPVESMNDLSGREYNQFNESLLKIIRINPMATQEEIDFISARLRIL